MRKISSVKLLPIVATLAFAASGNASASTSCNTLSPEFEKLGDSYFNIEDVEKTHEERLRSNQRDPDNNSLVASSRLKKSNRLTKRSSRRSTKKADLDIENFIKELKNTRKTTSSGEIIVCRNDEDDVVRTNLKIKHLTLSERSNGEHVLAGMAESEQNNFAKRMAIDIPDAKSWKYDKNTNEYRVRERYRKSTEAGAYMVEVELRMQQNGSEIELHRTLYVNGYWAESLTWQVEV